MPCGLGPDSCPGCAVFCGGGGTGLGLWEDPEPAAHSEGSWGVGCWGLERDEALRVAQALGRSHTMHGRSPKLFIFLFIIVGFTMLPVGS